MGQLIPEFDNAGLQTSINIGLTDMTEQTLLLCRKLCSESVIRSRVVQRSIRCISSICVCMTAVRLLIIAEVLDY